MPSLRPLARLCALLFVLCCGFAVAAQAQTTRVSNTATLTFGTGSGERTIQSNTVALDVSRVKVPTRLSFRIPPVGYDVSGVSCQTSPTLVGMSVPISADTLARSPPMAVLDIRQPVIMVLEDTSSNKDHGARDAVLIDVDTPSVHEQVRLMETGPDTNVFAGGFPPQLEGPRVDPCEIRLLRNEHLHLSIAEDADSYASSADMLVDPSGYIFDSTTGALLDGAEITLLDASGQPAAVYGDDGISRYPSTIISGQDVTDSSGRVYDAQPGRYRFPLTAPGQYSFRITPPAGYTAPSTVDRDSLMKLRDLRGRAFVINEASYLQTFTVTADADFLADVPLDRPSDVSLLLTKVASVRDASPGDFIQYRLRLTNRGTQPAIGVEVHDILPVGLRYERGSTRGGDEPAIDGSSRSLTFALPAIAGGASADLTYVVSVTPGAPTGEALNRATASGRGAPVSNEAAASVRIKSLLFTDAMTIVGRVTEGACGDPLSKRKGIPGIRLLLEDGTFVVTDRDGLYHIEGVRPGRHVLQLDRASVPATHAPVACDTDTRQAGSAISRFVEGSGGLLKRVDFQLRPTGAAKQAQAPLPIAVVDDATASGDRDWLAGQTPGIDWLFPQVDHNPRAPAVRVVVKHLPGQKVALTINGQRSEPLAFDGSDADRRHGVAISRWSGIPLVPGDNQLVARVLDADGKEARRLERVVHLAGAARRAEFDAAKSRLVADGLTQPLIAVRVTDKDGRPARAGTLVPFAVEQPYVAAVEADLQQARQLAGRERAKVVGRVVGDEGIAFLALQPTTQAGAVKLTVTLTEDKTIQTSQIRAWLAASQKDWTVVGFGAGTLGYDTLRRHGTALPRGERNQLVTDGQLAVYAKGRIKGSWLLTLAYDSDRRYDPDRGLLSVIDPNRYYTVYGDGSAQAYDAPTSRKLYLRLERREFYALFGDFESGFTETQLTRYNRTLNGVKAAYEGERLRATGFAAYSDTLYARDEIQGNGLSGPYRLSGRNIVPNSDKLTIEVRDRFRSEKIVSSQAMTRHIDYDIDVDSGTLRFRSPVLSRDAALNPIFIVVDYEVEGGHNDKLSAAARVATHFADKRVEVGASAIHDETVGAATILGVDIKAHAGRRTEIRAEAATGGRGGLGDGQAFLAEVEHHGGGLDLLGYARQQDQSFGVGQQNLVEAGTRKLGLDGRLRLSERLSLTATGWHQTQLETPGSRIAGEARLEYRRDTGTVFVGGQFAADRGIDGRDRDSRLLTVGGSQALFDDKLVLTGQTQFAPGGDKGSTDFPVRHQLTAAYRLTKDVRLLGGYEIADGDTYTAQTARLGFDLAPWTGAKLMSTLNQQAVGENGQRTFAQYGLSQSLPVGKRWTLDGTLDASSTLRGKIDPGARITPFQTTAGGSAVGSAGRDDPNGSYVAATLAATYRAERWSWNGRLEYRDGEANDRWGVTSNLLRTLGEGRTLASSVKAYLLRDRSGAVAASASADLALALRPLDSPWSLLERLVLRHDRADAGFDDTNVIGVPAYGGGDQTTSRILNNLALNYRSGAEGGGHGFEGTLYYGAKYVRGRFADDVYDGFIDVVGFELRQDLSARVDLGLQGSVQHAWERKVVAFSAGPTVGVSPADNLWLTVGYNVTGYRDPDFEADRYTRSGPFVTLRMKFDRDTIAGAGRALLGRRG
ncbi:DUF11 domain-containing protein [Sphingomonas sp. ac-8]|uniref:DUF11 domain-containing protein n=1 Tax=Sphingomonas sp. ac-8 TaxID=3242977 RepID=UPI003A807EE1